jgi:hypothetical protein
MNAQNLDSSRLVKDSLDLLMQATESNRKLHLMEVNDSIGFSAKVNIKMLLTAPPSPRIVKIDGRGQNLRRISGSPALAGGYGGYRGYLLSYLIH